MPDPTEITPGQEPLAPEPQIDPSMEQARNLYEGLQNLDTRGDRLNELLRPGQDLPPGMDWNQVRAMAWAQSQQQPEEPPDMFEETYGPAEPQFLGYDQQGQPVYDQQPQQQQGFDPRSLAPVFDQLGATVEERAFEKAKGWFMEQVREQSTSTAISEVARENNLSELSKQAVEALTRAEIARQPNRAPGDVAKEVAQSYINDRNESFVAQGGQPPISRPGIPSGPVPGESIPRTDAESMEMSRHGLRP